MLARPAILGLKKLVELSLATTRTFALIFEEMSCKHNFIIYIHRKSLVHKDEVVCLPMSVFPNEQDKQ